MPRNRGIGDYIPRSGEARALVEVKGKVGSKMAFNRRRARNSIKNEAYDMRNATFANANWDENQPNLIWRGNNADASGITRLLTINESEVGSGEGNPDGFVKRLDYEIAFLAGIGNGRINGTQATWNQAARDDIPSTSEGFTEASGYTGALLSGTIDNSALIGPTSQAEGLPVRLWLMYETLSQAAQDPNTEYGSLDSVLSDRNRTVFWSTIIVPTLYSPKVVRIHKRFPGRGVKLSAGQREVSQITLACQGYAGMGTVVFPVLTMAVGRRSVWYRKDG